MGHQKWFSSRTMFIIETALTGALSISTYIRLFYYTDLTRELWLRRARVTTSPCSHMP